MEITTDLNIHLMYTNGARGTQKKENDSPHLHREGETVSDSRIVSRECSRQLANVHLGRSLGSSLRFCGLVRLEQLRWCVSIPKYYPWGSERTGERAPSPLHSEAITSSIRTILPYALDSYPQKTIAASTQHGMGISGLEEP